MKHLNKEQLWERCVGMTWVWDYCATGTASENARGVQGWLERDGESTASLKTCAAVAAQIRRWSKAPLAKIGSGFGETRFG